VRWTKLKQRLEERFAAEVVGRVELRFTRYREAHDDEGEFWLTLDRQKVYGASYCAHVKALADELDANPRAERGAVERRLADQGVASDSRIWEALMASLSQPIDDMLRSPHPLIRALGVLDGRCGVRRLAKLDLGSEHDMVRRFATLRRSGSQRRSGVVEDVIGISGQALSD
jgi:hypothetical protein